MKNENRSTPKTERSRDAVKRRMRRLVSLWADRAKALHIAQDNLSDLMMASPEAPLFKAAWDCFDGYTRNLAEIIGDEDGWLEWYAWECQLGKNPLEMKFANGERLMVCGVEDVVDVIHTDEDGNRIFNG